MADLPTLVAVLELERLSIEEIADALQDQTGYGHLHLINPGTGELMIWTEDLGIDGKTPMDLDELDELGLVTIEPIPSYVWYQDMVDFAGGLSDQHARDHLGRALDGRGAFRRFRGTIDRQSPRVQSTWREFREVRARRRAVEWLLGNSLIDDASADRYFEENPDPELP